MDEKTVLSCSVPVGRADGHRITTLEGVEKEAKEFADFMAKEGGGAMWILFTGNDDAGACHEKGKQDLDR